MNKLEVMRAENEKTKKELEQRIAYNERLIEKFGIDNIDKLRDDVEHLKMLLSEEKDKTAFLSKKMDNYEKVMLKHRILLNAIA